jgi:hypothetical protein
MGTEKLGIDNLVDVAVDAIQLGKEVAEATKDGVQLTDSLVIIGNFDRIGRLGKQYKQAYAELRDLTPGEAEKAAMEISVRARLENDGTVLAKASVALKLAARTYRHVENTVDLVEDWKNLVTA